MHAAHTTTGSDALVTSNKRDLILAYVSLAAPAKAIRKPRVAKMPARVTDGERHPVTTWKRMTDVQVAAYFAGEFDPADVRFTQGAVLYSA